MSLRGFARSILYWPVRCLTRFEIILDKAAQAAVGTDQVVYVMRSTSVTDLIVAEQALQQAGLPSAKQPLLLNGHEFPRVMYLANGKDHSGMAVIDQLLALLEAHQHDRAINVHVLPLGLFWGRKPGQERRQGNAMVADLDNPGKWRKFWLILFSGRHILVRGSAPLQLRQMTDENAVDRRRAHKLARVARVHFVRLRHAVAGPKITERGDVIRTLLATPALQQAIADEAKSKRISRTEAERIAAKYLNEIAANYSDTLVRVLDRFMGWMWSKIYHGVHIEGGHRIRALAQAGHEIIYVPCHRSHMDYLLLSYTIYKEGLVPPHIAAGVNLDFFPAGPLFRRGGAFFLRRSFKGNKLYSEVFREYLNRLFQKGYPVEYFTEGGRSRTGRLLPPKTGMLAMTIQGMLRGQTRPMSIVPVYLGYEHVMEVATYLQELQGSSKKKESIIQVLASLRHLKNFGDGYVTFGEPINLGEALDNLQPSWRESITVGAEEPARPKWLTPTVNLLAEQVMQRINNAAALNSINLSALALLSAQQHSLTREELVSQLDLYVTLLREVPYSLDSYVPSASGAELWQLASKQTKFTIISDSMGELIQLQGNNAIAMTYYRNNIMHMVIVPAILAALAVAREQFTEATAVALLEQLHPLLQDELFISHDRHSIAIWIAALLQQYTEMQLLYRHPDGSYQTPARDSCYFFQLQLLAGGASETLQRYSIVLELLQQAQPISRADLEQQAVALAQRLSALHGIEAPEFFDKKVLTGLIATLKAETYIDVDQQGQLIADQRVGEFSDGIDSLIEPAVIQTIRQSVQHWLASRNSS